MTEDPQVVSISSSLPLSPDEIARKSFPPARRGVDGEAVRQFLAKVAGELRELTEREAMLRTRVVEAERRAEDPELDEATLTRAIGIETAKILWTAHDAAKNVVSTAEQRAAELLAEAEHVLERQIEAADIEVQEIRLVAEQEVAELQSHAQAEAESLTGDAHADAVELLDATKEECRRMVAEARELRNRTLADLATRRRALHIQLEELRTGKDSLLRVVDGVAYTVDELRERLASAEDAARVAAEEAGRRVSEEADHDDLVELEAELAAASGGLAAGGIGKDEIVSVVPTPTLPEVEGGAEPTPGGESPLEGGPQQEASSASRRSVDELFARIRASRAAEEAAAQTAGSGPVEKASPGQDTTAPLAGTERPGTDGIYDIEAVTAAEADVNAPPAAKLAEPPPEAPEVEAHEPDAVGDGTVEATSAEPAEAGGAGEAGGDGDLTVAVEIVEIAAAEITVAESGAGEGSPGKGSEGGDGSPGEGAEGAAGEGVEGQAVPQNSAAGEDRGPEEVTAEFEAAEAAIEAEAITEPDVEALARRDHLLGPIIAKLGRSLKRALQDDQNELLNALRQASGKPVLDELMPPSLQRERLVSAAEEHLARAYEAGAAFLVAGDTVEGPSVSAVAPTEMVAFEAGTLLATELAEDLTSLLRQRIEQSLSELDGGLEGSADAAGAAYREWKGTRVEGLAGDFATRAFAVGELAVLSSLGEGEAPLVRWVVEDDDAGGSCPDCDDNSLAGPQVPGAEFPTGHVRPPAHPGCRCLLVPVRS